MKAQDLQLRAFEECGDLLWKDLFCELLLFGWGYMGFPYPLIKPQNTKFVRVQ